MADQDKGRVAIRFAPSSSTKKPLHHSSAPTALGKRPRSHAFGGGQGSDSDDDEHRRHKGQHEVITGFGVDGAEVKRERKDDEATIKARVIQRQPNRDWRAEAKARRGSRNPLPEEAMHQQDSLIVERAHADQHKEVHWGFTVKKNKTDEEHELSGDSPRHENLAEQTDTKYRSPPTKRTVDDKAMDALMGRVSTANKTIIQPPLSEDDAYRRDAEAAGVESTLDDYEAMPVEEFGAALLRGMGWNGEPRGPKPKEARRRANRLGLGAKELKESEDLGGWDQKGVKKRRPRLDEYRRDETRRRERRRNEDSYKGNRERERDGYGDKDRNVPRRRDHLSDDNRDRRR